VVGYDHGGVGELLRRIFPGGLVLPGDRQELLQRVLWALRGGAVRGEFPGELGLGEMLRKTVDLYEKIVSDHHRAGEFAAAGEPGAADLH